MVLDDPHDKENVDLVVTPTSTSQSRSGTLSRVLSLNI